MMPNRGHCGPTNLTRDTQAVSEIVGTLVLIGVAVMTVAGFALYVTTLPQPEADAFVTLDAKASRGGAAWNDGDERILVRHLGGDSLPSETTRILIQVDGVGSTFSGTDLGGGFADGSLDIGEEWATTLQIREGATVRIFVVLAQGLAETTIFTATPEAVA